MKTSKGYFLMPGLWVEQEKGKGKSKALSLSTTSTFQANPLLYPWLISDSEERGLASFLW